MAEIACAASFFSNKCFSSQVFAGVLSGRHRFKSSAIFSLLTILNFDYWRCSSYCWHQDILEQTLHALTCLRYRCCGLVSLCLSCSENALFPQIFFSAPLKDYLVHSIQERHCFYIHSLLDESKKLFESTF